MPWRGINLGGALDGGRDWLRDRHLALGSALRRDLDVVLDVHHFDGADRRPDRLLAPA